jgi:hypothetical protein
VADGPTLATVLVTLADQLTALTARVAALEAAQPLEPLYTITEAAFLIPCSRSALEQRLLQHKARLTPAYYRITAARRRQRLIPASDLRLLRAWSLRRGPRTRPHPHATAA